MTWLDKFEALLKRFKYLKAKERETGSSTSKIVESSFFSLSLPLMVMLPPPISPLTENLIDSFEVSRVTIIELTRVKVKMLLCHTEYSHIFYALYISLDKIGSKILPVSEIWDISLQILVNSDELIVTIEL